MLTIIEGPDGSGKTRLAEWYAENCGDERVDIDHHGSYPGIKNTFDSYYSSIAHVLDPKLKRPIHMIMDRAWFGELVYGPIRKNPRGNRVGTAGRRMLERGALSAQAVVVLCMPPLSVCQDWFLSKPETEDTFLEQHAKPDELLSLHERTYREYSRFASGSYKCSLPLIVYDPMQHSYEELRATIASVRPQPNGGPGIGAWKPNRSLLVVSEGVPYFNTYEKSEAARVTNDLEAFNVPESELYWMKPNNSGYWVTNLRPFRVFAIGKRAHTWCRHIGCTGAWTLPHTMTWHATYPAMPHPLAREASKALQQRAQSAKPEHWKH